MNKDKLTRISSTAWQIEPHGKMQVPAILYCDEELLLGMSDRVYDQCVNVASLPGIVASCYAMPDAHWGYGFPIGGVAAFDPETGGVVSAGGVGFDISCGVRTLHTGLVRNDIESVKEKLAAELYARIPAGVGSTGTLTLNAREMDEMLVGGAAWAVRKGYGLSEDLGFTEEHGCMAGAEPSNVSEKAKTRQRAEMGTLGSGNHYLEVQWVSDIYEPGAAAAFGLSLNDVVVSIHCGSRGLGHQIGTEYLQEMVVAEPHYGITLPDRELACAPLTSSLGLRYLGAMRAGINCALANRQIITHLVRGVVADVFPDTSLHMLYDVSHNTCKQETHEINGVERSLFVHRKGATRAFGPGHPELPEQYRNAGQPVLIGGSMGTESYILAGTTSSEELSLSSACHGAGRRMSRTQARKTWQGKALIESLAGQGIIIHSPSYRGVAEEAPDAYKDAGAVVDVADRAGLSRKVAKLRPLICIKG